MTLGPFLDRKHQRSHPWVLSGAVIQKMGVPHVTGGESLGDADIKRDAGRFVYPLDYRDPGTSDYFGITSNESIVCQLSRYLSCLELTCL